MIIVTEKRLNQIVDEHLDVIGDRVGAALKEHGFTLIQDKMSGRYLRRFKFQAKTVIDVGVSRGSNFLYETLPDAKFVLIDPLPGFRQTVSERFGDRYNFDFVECAVGSSDGHASLKIQSDNASKSTLGEPTRVQGRNTAEEVPVRVRRLDDVMSEKPYQGPYGLKLDTEGHELEVLKGATETLKKTEFVLAEVSIKQRYVNGYRFSEVVRLLAESGFELIDILNPVNRVHLFFDCLFLRADSPLFADRSI